MRHASSARETERYGARQSVESGDGKNPRVAAGRSNLDFERVDIRDRGRRRSCHGGRPLRCRSVHLAAQVAVTTSRGRPRTGFCDQCPRHIQRARRHSAPLSGGCLHLCLDKQGLRQDRAPRRPSCAAIGTPTSTGPTASAKASRSISCRPTGARRALQISTSLISREFTRSLPRRFGSRASTDRASSAWRIRAAA